MLAILKIFLFGMFLILLYSALVGTLKFIKDLHDFKQEKQFSGNREQLIKQLIFEEEWKRSFKDIDLKNILKDGDYNVY